jgi:Carboxypeptidase regulatory-like domain/TonB-dependent Receptor Plug Domain
LRAKRLAGFFRRAAKSACLARALAVLLGIVLFGGEAARAADTAKLSGVAFTVGTDQVQTVWPNARVTLKNKETQNAVSTVTSDLGEFSFVGVAAGEYELTVALAGFEDARRPVSLAPRADVHLEIQLRPKKQAEQVRVTGEAPGVDVTTTETSGPTLSTNTLKSVPLVNERFQDALPLVPGVVRGPDGLINIKGGRANQSGTLVNSTSAVDPVTGLGAITLPLEAVESVKVLSNPFSAEYGRFAGGIVDLETRAGTDKWRFLFTNFFPRFRYRNGSFVGLESVTPRITFAGPLEKGKLYLFQSFDYRFVRVRVPSLPDLQNDQVLETFDSYTALDWNVNATNHFTGTLSIYPQNLQFVNMNTFNPENVSPDYRQRGYFVALKERAIFSSGGFLESVFSIQRFDAHIFPARFQASGLDLFPEQNFGTYFNRQDRESQLYQWAQTYHFRPLLGHGSHLIEVGYSYARSNYEGTLTNLPVLVFREDRTLSQRITSTGPGALSTDKNDLAFFFQDKWQLHPRFALDWGARLDRDDLSRDPVNLAPRIGFVFAPMQDNKTAVRGGVGVFYDKIPLNVATFLSYPAQVITRFDSTGLNIADGPRTFTHVLATRGAGLHVPYSLSWVLQVDRELRRGLLFRFGYEQRETHRDFIVQPVESATSATLELRNGGRQRYREFQWTLKWQPGERTTVYFSYLRSRAAGNLNGFDQYFGNFPNPIIRPDQFGRLSYDAPNRLLIWGVIGLPWKLEFAPVLDVHDGFPFSEVDNDLNFIGLRNGAGRFPRFTAFDMQVRRPFKVEFLHKKHTITAGLKIFNLFRHDNPRDVQQNLSSPNFGSFFNSVPREFRAKFEFDF